jgi:hypothetical protein
MRRVYRLRVYLGPDLVEELLAIPSTRLPLAAIVGELRRALPEQVRLDVTELDPETGAPRLPTAIERALDELLGDLR